MNREQKAAWLALEGWLYHPYPAGNPYASKDGDLYVEVLAEEDTIYATPVERASYFLRSEIRHGRNYSVSWAEAPDDELNVLYIAVKVYHESQLL